MVQFRSLKCSTYWTDDGGCKGSERPLPNAHACRVPCTGEMLPRVRGSPSVWTHWPCQVTGRKDTNGAVGEVTGWEADVHAADPESAADMTASHRAPRP